MSENKDKELTKELFEKFKEYLFSDTIYKMKDKDLNELFDQLVNSFTSNIKKFSINNLIQHVPELIQYSIALGIRLGIDFKNWDESNRKIRDKIEKLKCDSYYI